MPTKQRLFTPGPLTTHERVKQAMLRDLGSRDAEFNDVVFDCCSRILQQAKVAADEFGVVMFPGSGTHGIEAVLASITPPNGKWLVIVNGVYGRRMTQILTRYQIACEVYEIPEDQVLDLHAIEEQLKADPSISHVGVVHCETTTGMMNDIQAMGELAYRYQKIYYVDAMSSFFGVPIDLQACHIDYLTTSSNKCVEGLPGIAIVLAKTDQVSQVKDFSRVFSLDLYTQWLTFKPGGMRPFRFTPSVQVLLALQEALKLLEEEGGVEARYQRYQRNHHVLRQGMRALGFELYLPESLQGPIITAFLYPDAPFKFQDFYQALHDQGLVIYPGSVTHQDVFRIGTIGQLFEQDMHDVLRAIERISVCPHG